MIVNKIYEEDAMEIREQQQNGVLVMHISSQIDSTTGPMLGERLDKAIHRGHVQLVLDLSAVPYISSAGLRVLSVALKAVRDPDKGGPIYGTNANPPEPPSQVQKGVGRRFVRVSVIDEDRPVVAETDFCEYRVVLPEGITIP